MVHYDDFATTFGASRRDMHWTDIHTLLDDCITFLDKKTTWNIADIGCGNGRLLRHVLAEPEYLQAFQAHSVQYLGIDLSGLLLDQARSDISLSTAVDTLRWINADMGDIDRLDMGDALDACFFVASFHHLETYEAREHVLRSIRRHLSPGGKIFMTNWHLLSAGNEKYLPSRIREYDDGSADFLIKIGSHKRYYHSFSLCEYERLAIECGYSITSCDFGDKNSVSIWQSVSSSGDVLRQETTDYSV